MRIALYGGSFNPAVAKHHLQIADAALKFADQVWLLPCRDSRSYGKRLESDQHRGEMCRLAVHEHGNKKLRVCDFEMQNQSSGNLNDIIRDIRRAFPHHSFLFVLGEDNAATLLEWPEGAELIKSIPFIVIPRSGRGALWYHRPPHVYLTDFMPLDESSTACRADLSRTGGLHDSVPKYIHSHSLFVTAKRPSSLTSLAKLSLVVVFVILLISAFNAK